MIKTEERHIWYDSVGRKVRLNDESPFDVCGLCHKSRHEVKELPKLSR